MGMAEVVRSYVREAEGKSGAKSSQEKALEEHLQITLGMEASV